MNKKQKILTTASFMVVILTGCSTVKHLNRLSVGMTKEQVIKVMGQPMSTAAADSSTEFMNYRLKTARSFIQFPLADEYFVKLVNGKVDSYAKKGDFDSAGPLK